MNLACSIELYAQRKLHYRTAFQGLPISVENRKGSVRKGCDPKWGCWHTKMKIPYGYIKGTKGMDGDEVDVFLGPNDSARMAYVITIKKQPNFIVDDEQKVMLGFNSAAEAKKAFLKHYDDSRFFGSMAAIPIEEFKKRVMRTKGNSRKLTASKLEQAMTAIGEPGVYEGGYAHMEGTPTFHPPSLKNAKRVPTDDPVEKDDSLLDVTKRKAKDTEKFRKERTRRIATPPQYGLPGGSTAVQHHTAVHIPWAPTQ